jgi:hypothetical protein
VAVASALLATASIRAGTITVGNLPATGTDAATGISTTNSYLCCLDFGNGTAVGSINGVPFEHLGFPNTATANSGTETNHGGTWNITASLNLASTSGGSVSASSQADGSTAILLTDLGYVASSAPANSWLVQNYGGLSAGAKYALRFYYRQWQTTGTRAINIAFNGEGTNQPYSGNPLNEDIGGAHYLEYDFTANSGSVFVYMTNLNNNESALIYGMSLQQTAAAVTNAKPSIITQPAGFTNWAGFSGSLSVSASGSPAPVYQWFQNGKAVRGDTNSLITFSPLVATNAGSYYVIVTNVAGAVTSSVVMVDVLAGTNVISPTLSQVQLPATGTDAATGIGTGSNYLCVLAFADSAFSGAINGVNFTPVSLSGATQSGTDPNYGGAWTASTTDANGFKDVTGGGASLTGQADGNMASVLAGASYLGVAPVATTATLNFGYLAPGAKYFLRYYYRQWDAGDSPARPVQFVFNGNGTNATFQTDEDIGGAYYLEYDFTAASNTVSLLLTDESTVANQGPMLYAITLQAAAPSSLAPVILTQPAGGSNAPGASFDFSVAAYGTPPLAYRWYKNGGAIAGATNAMLGYGYLQLSDAGSYQAVVTNASGAVTSTVAPLSVAGSIPVAPNPAPTDAALLAAASAAEALASAADAAQATTNWSAHWIGPAASTTNLWLCYRKTFSLSNQPASAVACIAADSKYWLWVNGQMAVREGGLKRGPTANDTWYDQIDLSPLLQAGSNTIAVLHWFFGKPGFSHTNSGTAGFLFQMNAGGTWVSSDTTWRMITNIALQLATVVPQPNFRLPESSLRFDARLNPGAWTNQTFDDSGWSSPTDWGTVGGLPWGWLWQRPLPLWQNTLLQDFVSTNVAGSSPAIWTCYLPVNQQFTPWLDVSSSSSGLIITIESDAATNGGDSCVNDEYVTTTGRQSFEFPGWINGNFVQFTVPSGITVYGLQYRPHLADTDLYGSFDCDDPTLVTLWNKAANTLGVNMADTWMDCPNRERANWLGDVCIDLGQAPYAYDPQAELISRKSLLDMIRWQRADDTMFGPVPAGNWSEELPVQTLAAVGQYGALRYYRDTGDLAFLQQCYPAIRSYLLNVWQTDSQGLVIHRNGGWDWEDWGDDIDEPLLDNTWYFLALNAAAQMAPLVGQAGDAPLFSSIAQGISNQFNAAFWTGSAYRSPTNTTFTDERGNAMAVLAGLTGPSQAAALRSVLITQQHCSPYMEKYVLEALFTLGYPDDALARMRSRYAAMISSTSTTLWELFPASGTFNHGWSGGPLTLLDEQVAGVTPTSPGFATFDVRPALGTTLSRAAVNVPSRQGLICVLAAQNAGNYRLSVRVPPGSAGRAFQPGRGGLLSGAVLSVAGGATAIMDETLAPPQISITDGDATLLSTNGGIGEITQSGSGTLLLGAGSALSLGVFEITQGETILSAGGQLTAAAGVATNTGQAYDGHLTIWPGAVLSIQGGTVSCASLTNLGVCECLSGSLIIRGNATNGGTLRLLGNAQLQVGGAFINSGVLDIMTWSGVLPPGFVNNGVLLNRSAIKVESCAAEGSNLNVTIMGYAGHTYQLQYSNNLRPAVWTNVETAQAGNGAPLVLTHANGLAAGQRFYRVALDPPSY